MLNSLDQELDKLSPSPFIITLRLGSRYSGDQHVISSNQARNPKFKGDPNTTIGKLVRSRYQEDLYIDGYRPDREAIKASCINSIQQYIVDFLKSHMPRKHPMESTQGKWYRDRGFNFDAQFEAAIIGVYIYMVDNNINDGSAYSNKHVQNSLHLLEYLFIKHRASQPKS